MLNLIKHSIYNYQTYKAVQYQKLDISYQVFGQKLHTAPVVLVNHALTGNSDVASKNGWWNTIVGAGKVIDTTRFTVIAFNILGNGYDGNLIRNYKYFSAKDIARIFLTVLEQIGVKKIFALIGGSLGGGIAWEMAALKPTYIEYLIPIATNWKSTDWIIGHNYIQEQLLENSTKPLEDARMMAMLFYRTPASFTQKFQRTKTENGEQFSVASWLEHHGDKLEKRFKLLAYKMMNHLLTTIDISQKQKSFEQVLTNVKSTIIQVAIDTDLFFVKEENLKNKVVLDTLGIKNEYHEIKSIHGHDAFLIEYQQLETILKPIFNRSLVSRKHLSVRNAQTVDKQDFIFKYHK